MPKIHSSTIEALSHEGRGIAPHHQKTALIRGALPGEHVTWRELRRRQGVVEGLCTEVEANPSAERIEARCLHFGQCGGCSLQHWDRQAQVLHFQQVLVEQLEKIDGLKVEEVAEPLMASPWHYRRRARLSVRYVAKKEKVVVGFREIDGRFVNDMSACHILVEPLAALIRPLISLLNELDIKHGIPQVELSAGDDANAIVIRHMEDWTAEDRQRLLDFAEQHNVHLYTQEKDPWQLHKLYPEGGEHLLSYGMPDYGLTMSFHPCDFIQVNGEMNQMMVRQAVAWLDIQPEDRVLDAFCGSGNFTLPVATQARETIGIEGDVRLVSRATMNAEANHLSQKCRFYEQDCYQCQGNLPWLNERYDKLILDPPRSGAAPLIEYMAQQLPSTILYVSCHMSTFVRDAELLAKLGYRFEKVGVMDMFTWTGHAEVMGKLVRGG